MSINISDLSVAQLKQAIGIKEQIERLQNELGSLLGSNASNQSKAAKPTPTAKPAAARSKVRKPMSAAAKARLSAFAKQRWANAKASGKKTL